MADVVVDTGSALIGNAGGGAGGDVRMQFYSVEFTTTDVAASITGINLTTVIGIAISRCEDTLPAHADLTFPYIDQDKNSSGYWDITSGALAIARQVVTSGTAATETFSVILFGY